MVISRAIRGACFPLVMALSSALPEASVAQSLTLEEVDRFTARLPHALEYDTASCSLWVSGPSPIVQRISLQGSEIVEHDTGLEGQPFVVAFDGEAIAYSHSGQAVRLFSGATPVREAGFPTISEFHRFVGGDITASGFAITATETGTTLVVFRPSGRGPSLYIGESARLPDPLLYRGVAYDPGLDEILTLVTNGQETRLRTYNIRYETVSSTVLPSEFGLAEGLAVQHETGNVFISYMEPGHSEGEVVQYQVIRPGPSDNDVPRPVYECLVS